MNRLPATLLLLLTIAIPVLLAGCSTPEERVAGGGGVEVEGITVEGMAYYPDNQPAIGALVRVRPWDYLQPAASPKSARDRADTLTDSLGRFTVDSLDPGVYSIVVDAGESGQAMMKVEADGSRKLIEVEGTVWAGGTVSGHVLAAGGLPLAGASVGIYGMDRSVRTDEAGAFLLEGLAPGIYTLKVLPTSDSLSSVDIPEVAVGAGSRVVLDSLTLPRRAAGLRAQWGFDEGVGKVAADASGSEARMILYGGLWSPGREGQALDLRDRAYAAVPRSKSASLAVGAGRDFMVTLWFKADPSAGIGTSRTLADTRTFYTPQGWRLGLQEDGRALFLARQPKDEAKPDGELADTRLAGGPRLDDGNWHHIAAGRSGTHYLLYVNGALAAETEAPSGLLTEESALYLGALEGKAEFFTGLVDDLRLHDRALTAGEALESARP